ncbi:MAG: hypothetical protein KF708_09830 [Pirellulales bacterium]|nr:hypothetical protein [Pirellulales bacterium]
MTDDELELSLDRSIQTHPAPPLRARVLAQVSQELTTIRRQRRSWGKRVAAAILVALGLNLAVGSLVHERLSSYRHPSEDLLVTVPRSFAQAEPVTRWPPAWLRWLQASPAPNPDSFEQYAHLLFVRASQQDGPSIP